MCVCSCGLDSEAGPAGLAGADPAAKAEGGYPQRCDGGSKPATTLCHHLLWCERGGQIYQPGQGEEAAGLHCAKSSFVFRNLVSENVLEVHF